MFHAFYASHLQNLLLALKNEPATTVVVCKVCGPEWKRSYLETGYTYGLTECNPVISSSVCVLMGWIAAPTTAGTAGERLIVAYYPHARRTTKKRSNHPDSLKLQALQKLLHQSCTTNFAWNCVRRAQNDKMALDIPQTPLSASQLKNGWMRGNFSNSGITKIFDTRAGQARCHCSSSRARPCCCGARK